MKSSPALLKTTAIWALFPMLLCGTIRAAVTYEEFGAAGDGVTDDLPAIQKAHAHANLHGLPVRTNPEATYHLGRRALTAIIATDTDWGTSRFIIDDSQGVENHLLPLFEVRSLLKPLPLKIGSLARGQKLLDSKPSGDCLVLVENNKKRIFIRRGLNQNQGSKQMEVFILKRDGTIEGGIDWSYDVVTRVEARPIDPKPLVLRGGVFSNIANRADPEDQAEYWGRNIVIKRSNTTVDGITHRITGEMEHGNPYSGFLNAERCANITLRDCKIDARRFYQKIGSAGKPVPMGTYGYQANMVVNFRMTGCRMGDIHDRSRWGVTGTNFMKNILIENCVLSRMDVHQGVSGTYIIRGSTLGHAGLNAIGRGSLIVEDSTLHGRSLIRFREDYGSTWDGEVIIRNSRWIPPQGKSADLLMFDMNNDGTHDFGYPCSMPRLIQIDGLFVDDSGRGKNHRGVSFFGDPLGTSGDELPFPYRPTKRIEIRGLTTASGLPPQVSNNPKLAKAVTIVSKSAEDGFGETD